jgi:hypothetical protein
MGTILGAGGFSPLVLSSSVLGAAGQPSPSNRITIGSVGVGGEGTRNLMALLAQADAYDRRRPDA